MTPQRADTPQANAPPHVVVAHEPQRAEMPQANALAHVVGAHAPQGAAIVVSPRRRTIERHPDTIIADLAGQQLGIVSRTQLLEAGVSVQRIRSALRVGRLHIVHRGVYAVGHVALSVRARWLAAVLALGPEAVLSHRTAAALWDMTTPAAGPVDVSRAASHRRVRDGIRVHETAALPPAEIARQHGIPVTSPARTLLDLGTCVDARNLERAVTEAQARGLVGHADLRAMARSGRLGSVALRAVVEDPPSLTRSEAERRLLALLARAKLPRPHTNVRVCGHEVDAYWPEQRLVVEVDGYAFHSGKVAFERDRLRDAALQTAGYRVLRVTWRQVTSDPEALAARLGAALAPRRP